MVILIAIGANGDGMLHWRHYVHHHWSQWITIGTIYWRQWREPQIVMTLLPSNLYNYIFAPSRAHYKLFFDCPHTHDFLLQ